MAVPKRRTSKSRKRKRRTHWKLNAPNLIECPQCTELKLSHHVCKECGYYKGRAVK
ncbi:50S ribosomal protein L32 [Fuchsiella alkaliacetigena]|uniref:50S ribosomal protein L32 n=1 Tax=Fuchsiella alkaliacetigena TaxID=957042 RepID=UPI00200A0CD7|nr:50S ribosomal protein L32 [Fuchsiella alkaliacetigena]MCK8823956.1 50S ribosomal protein L32 [Fuchsiella alkaliacetigena]